MALNLSYSNFTDDELKRIYTVFNKVSELGYFKSNECYNELISLVDIFGNKMIETLEHIKKSYKGEYYTHTMMDMINLMAEMAERFYKKS